MRQARAIGHRLAQEGAMLSEHVFDTGIHYVGGFDKGQPLQKIYSYLGFYDKLKFKKLNAKAISQ